MKSTLKIKKLREEVSLELSRLSKCFFNKDGSLNQKIEQEFKQLELHNQILGVAVLRLTKELFDISNNQITYDLRVEKIIEAYYESENEAILFDFKKTCNNAFHSKIAKNISDSEIIYFELKPEDEYFKTLHLVYVFLNLIENEYALKKYTYFVKQKSNQEKFDLNLESVQLNILDLFNDAYTDYVDLIKNRINLFYINYFIDKIMPYIKNKGNYDLFKPDSEFAKIFNDKEKIPSFICELVNKFPLTKKNQNSFFTALRVLLQHSTYLNNEVLMNDNSSNNDLYSHIVSKFIGKPFTFRKQDLLSTSKIDEYQILFKKSVNANNLYIKVMNRQIT